MELYSNKRLGRPWYTSFNMATVVNEIAVNGVDEEESSGIIGEDLFDDGFPVTPALSPVLEIQCLVVVSPFLCATRCIVYPAYFTVYIRYHVTLPAGGPAPPAPGIGKAHF